MIRTSLTEKEEQRRILRKRLAERSEDERKAASRLLAERLVLLPEWQAARRVGLFASLPSEPNTDLLFERARQEGKRVFYPWFRGENRSLGFAEVEALEALHPGPLRFREPVAVEVGEEIEVDLLLIPGLGFDRSGMRLGRGGGSYDRTLAELRPDVVRAGLFFSWQELPRVAVEVHDRGMDIVVTEKELTRVGRRE
ncbi:5-formyltetrahydrofolate cyclo-ligase [Methylacidimicrobium cyclopophantes]|uniref:5-formyltetrahydrofolate cyclo-ligase n=1 Tax=Methylacidimicrobium cyclopophantes TaxID=1041766 RepID=A0A5E6MGX6_9BACT|nr:5-formyltetrahydrofolate cyclo-ligase [Methylacidimicrobium cyclopophantes]VVM08544.1 5-formyltetrahydrofolate cyclo-ligase [Methylacidimicrobium cyclopophantes]